MSQRDSGYERRERDLYETPGWVTEALKPHIFDYMRAIWEPACGSGKMALAMSGWGCSVVSSDIHAGEHVASGIWPDFSIRHWVADFLQVGLPKEAACAAIVTNPPYELATAFCEHALRLMEPIGGTVAMLLRTDFDHAKTRSHLFRDCPAFAKKVVLTKRIVWFEPLPGEKGKSPSFNHAWFIWDWRHEGAPTLAYSP